MSQNAHRYELDWLINPLSTDAPSYVHEKITDEIRHVERLHYPVPKELGTAWIDTLRIEEDFSIFHAQHDYRKSPVGIMLPLLNVDATGNEKNFSAQLFVSGICSHRETTRSDSDEIHEIVSGHNGAIFRYRQHWKTSVSIEGGKLTEMFSVVINDSRLTSYLGEETKCFLIEKVGLGGNCQTNAMQLPSHISSSLRESLSERHHGAIQCLYSQAKILEFLASLISFFNQQESQSKEGKHREKVFALHDYLIKLEGKLPTLNSLAEQTGLSARQLNHEFTLEFGESIFSFISNYRLEQAKIAIVQSNLPLKVLANRLGYSHINHFTTAFRKKFGYPPGSLRKSKDQ